jgi:hypothetical protein
MRRVNFIVHGFTSISMLAALAFGQTPNTGVKKNGAFVQAQAGQMGSQGQTDQKAPAGTDRMDTDRMDAGRYGDPMTSPVISGKDKAKARGAYHPQGRSARRDPAQDSPSQARMGKKQESRGSGE